MPVKRILLVDDEPEILKALQVRLVSLGYDVLTTSNGKEAVQLIENDKEKKIDAIVLDIMMPEMNGIEALRHIRAIDKKLPALMFTAYGDDKNFEEAEKLGISGFIHKGRGEGVAVSIHAFLKGIKARE